MHMGPIITLAVQASVVLGAEGLSVDSNGYSIPPALMLKSAQGAALESSLLPVSNRIHVICVRRRSRLLINGVRDEIVAAGKLMHLEQVRAVIHAVLIPGQVVEAGQQLLPYQTIFCAVLCKQGECQGSLHHRTHGTSALQVTRAVHL